MPLYTVQSNRLESLISPFTDILTTPDSSLLTQEMLLVQSIGMGRYFITRSAEKSGVAANFSFIYPQKFFQMLCSFYSITDTPTDKYTLAWRIFARISSTPGMLSPEMAQYAKGADELKLFKLSLAIADTFDQYTMYRSEMILEWERENPVVYHNGVPVPLEQQYMWQYRLFTALQQEGVTHRAALLQKLIAAVRKRTDLPCTRISALGLSNLPPFYLALLHALAGKIDVYMLLLNPSPHYWFDIVSERTFLQQEIVQRYNKDRSDHYYYLGNPLLSLYGIQGRDFHTLLLESGADSVDDTYFSLPEPDTLLKRLQNDLYTLTDRTEFADTEAEKFPYTHEDTSIQIHGCHNRMREMEIIHDQLLALFDSKSDLVPGDILVMTPKISEYAPYISAVFGTRSADGMPLPYTIADLSISESNTMAEAFLRILSLESERVTVSLLMSLLECDAVCQAFSITHANREDVLNMLQQSAFRSGIDEQDRQKTTGTAYDLCSLKRGLLRLCAGVAYESDDEIYGGITPALHLQTGMLDTAGALMHFMDTVAQYARMFHEERSAGEWISVLHECIEKFFSASQEEEPLLQEIYTAVQTVSEPITADTRLSFSVIRYLLIEHLGEEKKEFGFIDGRITFCEMLPMRSIPFRVIVMAGMDEGAFPRFLTPFSFDLIREYPRKGDRSIHNDDRYLFLETLLSARDHFIVTYNAYDVQDNTKKNPSALVTELIEYIRDNCDDPDAADTLIQYHRLQPFTPRYYEKGGSYFSYAQEYLDGARALCQAYQSPPVQNVSVTAPLQSELCDVDMKTLIYFFNNPYRFFLQNRATVRFPRNQTLPDDDEPTGIDTFTRNELIAEAVQGTLPDTMRTVLENRGEIPPLTPGTYQYASIQSTIAELSAKMTRYKKGNHRALETAYTASVDEVPITLYLALDTVYDDEYHFVYTEWKMYQKVSAWLVHLCLHACGYTMTGRFFTEKEMVLYQPVAQPEAQRIFNNILALYIRGQYAPLHFFKNASYDAYNIRQKDPDVSASDIAATLREKHVHGYYPLQEITNEYVAYCTNDPGLHIDEDFVACACTFYDGFLEVIRNEQYV